MPNNQLKKIAFIAWSKTKCMRMNEKKITPLNWRHVTFNVIRRRSLGIAANLSLLHSILWYIFFSLRFDTHFGQFISTRNILAVCNILLLCPRVSRFFLCASKTQNDFISTHRWIVMWRAYWRKKFTLSVLIGVALSFELQLIGSFCDGLKSIYFMYKNVMYSDESIAILTETK